jgi:hypothetical protein
MTFTLGEVARQCGVAKGTISKTIKTGKLSAIRREDGSWSINNAELARYLEVTRETADLFLALIIRILKPGGRAAVVVPDGTLFGETDVKTRLKEQLMAECNLHTERRLGSSRLSATPPFGPWVGAQSGRHPAPKLSVGLHAVDALDYLAVLEHVVIVLGCAAQGEGHGNPRSTLECSASALRPAPVMRTGAAALGPPWMRFAV